MQVCGFHEKDAVDPLSSLSLPSICLFKWSVLPFQWRYWIDNTVIPCFLSSCFLATFASKSRHPCWLWTKRFFLLPPSSPPLQCNMVINSICILSSIWRWRQDSLFHGHINMVWAILCRQNQFSPLFIPYKTHEEEKRDSHGEGWGGFNRDSELQFSITTARPHDLTLHPVPTEY